MLGVVSVSDVGWFHSLREKRQSNVDVFDWASSINFFVVYCSVGKNIQEVKSRGRTSLFLADQVSGVLIHFVETI